MVHPYDERLHRVLMHCAYRSGSRAGVEAVLRNLALSLDWNGDPVDVVHFETADLYRQLTEGRDE
jgi:DNA-binding SARP family transcriptional activator